jgi:hypothetical protein
VILRSAAVLVFVAGALVLMAGLVLLGRAPGMPEATRHLRAMKDRLDPPSHVVDMTMEDLAALPHHAPLPTRSAIEARGVRIEGWVQRIGLSGDGDVHMELAQNRRRLGDRDTAYVVAEITPPWRRDSRGWSYESLLVALRPNRGGAGPWEAGPRHVRLTGWLNYDEPYDKDVSTWLLLNGAPRRTGWEVHPVTRVEIADETPGAPGVTWHEVKP